MTQTRNAYKILVRKPAGKEQFRRPGNSWEDNIKMDVKKKKWEGAE
jgi:hypothetical protein